MTSSNPGRVLVTGGASGLGAAVVREVAAAGGTAVILDRVRSEGPAQSLVVDLADTEAAARATHRAAAAGLDAVVTCAGTDSCGALADVPTAGWERVVQVNLLGTVAVIRAALPALIASGGRIVTVASTLGLRALPDATAYCAAKFGVIGFTRALGAELDGRVAVGCVIPGGMATPFFDGRPEQYRPAPDAPLMPPASVARAVLMMLTAAGDAVVRELLLTAQGEPSWP